MNATRHILTRRHLLAAAVAAPILTTSSRVEAAGAHARTTWPQARDLVRELHHLEDASGHRIGVRAVEVGSRRAFGFRADERFAMCSTSKVLSVAAVLHQDDGHLLRERIRVRRRDLTNYNPVTGQHVGGTMSVRALCAAAIEQSDNTAINLVQARIGGPDAVTRYLRGLGDRVTRLDRTEPALNSARPGDPRDTSTPTAMARTLVRLTLGGALPPRAEQRLVTWMRRCATGDDRIRAAAPPSWQVADKTGTGERGTANDVAVLWRPTAPPGVLVVFTTGRTASAQARSDVVAAAARTVLAPLR